MVDSAVKNITAQAALIIAASADLLEALVSLLDRHVALVSSGGDCGNWDVETEPSVITARAAIAKATGNQT